MSIDHPPPGPARPWLTRRRLARYALPTAVVVAAVAVLLHAGGGGTAAAAAARTGPAPTASPGVGLAPDDPTPQVNGCLGGRPGLNAAGAYVDLDQIALAARKQAPLTPAGAAEYTATIARWYAAMPRAASWSSTVPQIIAPKTDSLSHLLLTPGGTWTSGRLDFSDGGFYLESFDPAHAVVSWVAHGYGSSNGKATPPVIFEDAFHLVAVDGVWRLAEIAPVHTSVVELQPIATAYSGGC